MALSINISKLCWMQEYLPAPVVITGSAGIIDLICRTKCSVLGQGNFMGQGQEIEKMVAGKLTPAKSAWLTAI